MLSSTTTTHQRRLSMCSFDKPEVKRLEERIRDALQLGSDSTEDMISALQNTISFVTMQDERVKEWLAIRKAEALKIDPHTAEVTGQYGNICDSYGFGGLPDEYQVSGKLHFAR